MKEFKVVVTVEDKPTDINQLAEYLILLMDWDSKLKSE